jgi:hypothetical protein
MRITKNQLRQIILEVLEQDMDEMAYAGRLGVAFSRKSSKDFGAGGTGQYNPNPRAAAALALSKSFEDKALRLYAHLPFRVFVAPYVGNIEDIDARGINFTDGAISRGVVLKLTPKKIKQLQKMGYRNIPGDLSPDDLILLYTTSGAERGTMASPWMIFHAFFNIDGMDDDSAKEVSKISPTFIELGSKTYYAGPDDPLFPIIDEGADVPFDKYLTMGSARKGELGSYIESLAEVMTQELITGKGFVFSKAFETAPEEVQEAFKLLRKMIKQAAVEARQNLRGKILVVDVN